MSTYRPGYIEGKTKAGFYIDPKVQQALKVRAAQTGESMSDIAERALRRELGLMVDREDAIRTVNRLRSVRRERGALSAQEQAEMGAALAALEGERLVWRAWLGDWMMGEGQSEEAAIEAAVEEFEDALGYSDDIPDRETLIRRLTVDLAEDK